MRAPIMWFGGKGRMTKKLLPLLPVGRVYVEPFGGAGAMLFAKTPHEVEVYNDLNGDLVNLFRVLQDPESHLQFEHKSLHTLYSFEEFRRALAILRSEGAAPLDRAWAFFVAQNQGFGGKATTAGDWGRNFVSSCGMAGNTSTWVGRLAQIPAWHKRLLRVQIDRRDALEVIRYWDSDETVFYLDPPYIASTRAGNANDYEHEMSDEQHRALVALLLALKGKALLSGYAHPIYEPLTAAGWRRCDWKTVAYSAGRGRGSSIRGVGSALASVPRTETVWIKGDHMDTGFLWGNLLPETSP